MYKRGEVRLPDIQRHDVWRATRVRDLLDSWADGWNHPGHAIMKGLAASGFAILETNWK